MRPGLSKINATTGILLALAAAIAGVVALRLDFTGKQGSGLGDRFAYDLSLLRKTDPKLVLYRQTGTIETGFATVAGVAAAGEEVFVAGERAIRVFRRNGHRVSEIALDEAPRCLAVAPDATLYVGMKGHVEVYARDGARKAAWDDLGKDAFLTSVATSEGDVFAADAGQRIVWRFDTTGRVVNRIGERDPDRNVPGLVVPSPHLDLALGREGLLWVVDPGRHRIEAYTFGGDLELSWGKPSSGIDGFCGCCNPTDVAVLPDGRFVTSEKGLPRVKVHTPEGVFEGVVAGAEAFAEDAVGLDLAIGPDAAVLVLDPTARTVRIFERKPSAEEPIP